MGTIIGAKTCTWQLSTKTTTKTTTRLNLSSRQKPVLCLEGEQTIFPRHRPAAVVLIV